MNYQEKIEQHNEQLIKDGYLDYQCGDCGKIIWRKPLLENWYFCDECTLKREADDKANGVK